MKKTLCLFFIIFLLSRIIPLHAQDKGDNFPKAPLANPAVVVSSFLNMTNNNDEWIELLVIADNTNMQNWYLQDNNLSQTAWMSPPYRFRPVPLWANLRAGTVIMIWSHTNGHPTQINKTDGYIEVTADDPLYFTGGNGPGGSVLNIAVPGDLVRLMDASGTFVHTIGHMAPAGISFTNSPSPKLNYSNSLNNGSAVCVSPGPDLDHYGNLPASNPQDGNQWLAVETGAGLTFGLPSGQNPNNLAFPASANSDYWRSLRQPLWTAPSLSFTVNTANTQVTLNWNMATDPNPADLTQGYIIVRNTVNTFGIPVDGHTYLEGDPVTGGGTVIKEIPSSQTLTYIDNTAIPCATGFYYRVYAYRYFKDFVKPNDYDPARGRAYNETNYASVQAVYPLPVAPTSATATPTSYCAGTPPATILLEAPGGSGTTMNWYSGGCGTTSGGTLLGAGTGANNSYTINTPPVTPGTYPYYARWENACGNSTCVTATVTVNPNAPVSVTITANPPSPVCAGTPVTFTATPTNGGTTPAYQWKVNGSSVGPNSSTYTYTPANNDNITVELTSNAACASGNPATSNTIIMVVNPVLPVSCTIIPSQDPVCPGTPVTYTATPVNGGSNPTYAWHVNGGPVAGTGITYSYTPAAGDVITCVVTSNATCVSGNPATGTFIPTFSNSVLLSVTINPSQDPVCEGNPATYTAVPVNGGTNPTYEWHINGGAAVGNNSTYTYTPVPGDVITCIVSSNAGCVTNNPQTATFTPTFTSSVLLSVTITPGEDPVCTGTSVTYTAVPQNGGTAPTFEWHVNGGPVAGTNSTYSYIPANGDAITCIVNSNANCISNNPQTASFSPTVTTSLVVGVSITAGEDPVCAGTQVTYTAIPVNGGSSPTYDWFRTGFPGNVGTGSTYTCVPNAGDVITCILTSNAGCVVINTATATFNPEVLNSMVMNIALRASQDPACQGASITYTAHVDNGGSAPVFQWLVNGIVVTGIDSTYSYIPAPSDIIKCIVTSSSTCTSNNPDSNTFSPSVMAPLSVSVSVTADPTSACAGTEVTFTADTLNAGSSPDLNWFVNGASVQSGPSVTFKTSSLSSGEPVTCQLTSSLDCVVSNPVTSAPVSVSVSPVPHITLTSDPFICAGTATQLDAGPDYTSYLWQDGSTAQYYSASDVGLYWVRVTDTAGCTGGSDTVIVKVCETGIYVPTAFSPNGDGINDLFKVVATLDLNTSFTLSVVSRWGETVFESNKFTVGWDGTTNGQLMPPGIYAWKIVYQSVNSTEKPTTLKGTVTLLR